jgi:Uma2 family endonuclease
MIVRTVYENLQVTMPDTANTLEGFRSWAASDQFPDRGQVSFLHGEIMIDMSPEKVESHNQVKAEIDRVIGSLVKAMDIGKYYPDGLWLTNDKADLSTEPDGTFVSWETLERGDAHVVVTEEGEDGIEMRGSPDWVLEIVSTSSVDKDTRILPISYHVANIGEYWVIDARGEELQFTIFHRHPDGFEPARPDDGWLNSEG